ncbi:hypothetical protein HER10_EVM0007739 [Colletotrichum scovillei]|uniref:uncharacterized protein n=1 Tax=Colletotrichum scovillei TaxID=1209932 RepID=UPI0015C2CA89|nr:uncharacterized protein HER10_EVM0007739 [Colletotrichum scovillei]KAF4781135.1 hypothetical protein HER10_EVM0007739 [Colletotrichum scovillei]
MRKITVARRRFLDSDADKTSIPAEFFDFLHTIDHFIFKIESTFQTNVSKQLKKKRSRDESDDEPEEIQNTTKKARIADAYEEIEKMTQEEQIRYWKEKALGLKGKLEAQDEVVKGLHKLLHEMNDRKNRSSLEFNYCVTRLWDDALPKINEKQRQQSQTEWASSQLQEYLRATGSSRIADAMLGIADFTDDHIEEVRQSPLSPVESENEEEEKDEVPAVSADTTKSEPEAPSETGLMDLSSLSWRLPMPNLSAHPNIKSLPGLDFNVTFGAPFLPKRYSGILGNVLLPYGEKVRSHDHNGMMNVANRIETIMDVAVKIFQENHEMYTMQEISEKTFAKLRERWQQDITWNFLSSSQKTSTIVQKLVAARKLHLENNDGITTAREEFFPFLKAMDDFLEKVYHVRESREQVAKAQQDSEARSRKRSLLEEGSDVMMTSYKRARLDKEDNESGKSKALEEKVDVLKTQNEELEMKVKELEKKLHESTMK